MISRCTDVTYLINDDPMAGSHMCSCHPSFELGSLGRIDEVPLVPLVPLEEWIRSLPWWVKGCLHIFFSIIFSLHFNAVRLCVLVCTIQRFWDWIMAVHRNRCICWPTRRVDDVLLIGPRVFLLSNENRIQAFKWSKNYHWISLNHIEPLWFTESLRSFRAGLFRCFQWSAFFPLRKANLCAQIFAVLFLSPEFFSHRAPFETSRNNMHAETPQVSVFWFSVKLNCNSLKILKPIISLWGSYQQHAACWRIDMEVVGTDLVGSPPTSLTPQNSVEVSWT